MQAQLLFNTPTIKAYQALTFKQFQAKLDLPISPKDNLIPIGINLLGRPIAFLLANLEDQKIHIYSLFVEKTFRRQGLASLLLSTLNQYAKNNHIKKLSLSYVINRPESHLIESFLQAHQWSKPIPEMFLCHVEGIKVVEMLKSDWMNRYQLPDKFKLFPWSEITPKEFSALIENPFYIPEYTPEFENFETLNSLGLRYQGEIIGWMLTKAYKPNVILYHNLFIKKEYQKLGRAIPLLAASIKKQCQYNPHLQGGIWQTKAHNKPMIRFIKRCLAPFSEEIKETCLVYKDVI